MHFDKQCPAIDYYQSPIYLCDCDVFLWLENAAVQLSVQMHTKYVPSANIPNMLAKSNSTAHKEEQTQMFACKVTNNESPKKKRFFPLAGTGVSCLQLPTHVGSTRRDVSDAEKN